MKYRIRAGCLIDGKNPLQTNVIITIEDKKITDISKFKKEEFDKKKNTFINADNFTVLPGLIDMHVHATMHPGYIEKWDDWLKRKKEILLLKSHQNLLKMLLNGVTTARDCGAKEDLGFILRDAINEKMILGPRLVISGNPITITGGHCHYMGLESDKKIELIKSVRTMNKLDADFIKLMSTGGSLTSQSNRRGIQYDLEETKVLVEEAHKRNKKVAAHALGTEGIINSVKAGVDTIEHCAWLDLKNGFDFRKDIVKEIVEKNIYVNPTLPAAYCYLNRTNSENSVDIFKERMEFMKIMYNAGVKMLAGTDAGVPGIDFNKLSLSIKLLVTEVGMTNYDAIKAATSEAANALGMSSKIGSLEKGKVADIIAVKGNPLEDLNALDHIVMVIKDGKIIYQNENEVDNFKNLI